VAQGILDRLPALLGWSSVRRHEQDGVPSTHAVGDAGLRVGGPFTHNTGAAFPLAPGTDADHGSSLVLDLLPRLLPNPSTPGQTKGSRTEGTDEQEGSGSKPSVRLSVAGCGSESGGPE